MKQNPRYPHDVKEWFKKAKDDLKWGEYDFKGGFYSQVCLAAHQTVEKALKSFLLFHDIPVERIHDLNQLLKKCLKFDISLRKFKRDCQLIDKYYIKSRYPDFGPMGAYSKQEAKEALEIAKKILELVKKSLGNTS